MRPDRGCVSVGITIQGDLLKQIDQKRGDVPRSRYFQRLAEQDVRQKMLSGALGGQPSAAPTTTTDDTTPEGSNPTEGGSTGA
jgi:hypothetical protein